MKRRYTMLGLASFLAVALAVPALGGPSNPVAEGAASAKKIAKQAKKKAKKANQRAKAAQNTADAVGVAAAEAQSTANEANAAATDAQSTADNAQSSADAAQTSADAAQATADSAFKTNDFNAGTPSPVNSSNKSVSAACDSGDTLTGGGWTTTGGGNNDITAVINSSYLNGWIVTMEEVGAGTGDTWGVTATVQCIGKS